MSENKPKHTSLKTNKDTERQQLQNQFSQKNFRKWSASCDRVVFAIFDSDD